ncbi:hypothetical protein DESC_660052 [Desulfosarcina cetonica]|nr:hypothetical protein DESC_660052 [Desulfosarcina cetonica]
MFIQNLKHGNFSNTGLPTWQMVPKNAAVDISLDFDRKKREILGKGFNTRSGQPFRGRMTSREEEVTC